MARKVGLEVEMVYDDRNGGIRLLAELRDRGLRVIDMRHRYHGNSATEWCLKYDASVQGGGGGGELVSPHLDFDNPDDREQINQVFAAMQAAGCNSHESAGVHVHVECNEFTPKQIAAVARFCYKFEDALYRIASSGWTKMRPLKWCLPLPQEVGLAAMRIRTANQLRDNWHDKVTRYQMLNVHSWYRYGTLEFRLFNSTMNAERAQAYVSLCVAIVEDARRGYNRQTKTRYPLGWMAEDLTGQRSKDLFLRLQQILRYESGLAEADWKNLRKTCWADSVPQERNLILGLSVR